jgi:D-psicose/D-tagatose/L-ribulose 3-epimerase
MRIDDPVAEWPPLAGRAGINLMAWSATIGPAELALLPQLAELGYACVELPLLAPETVDTGAARRACEAAGLACTASSALPRGASLLDPAERKAGIAFLARCAAAAAECGATILCGPLYTPVGQLPGRPRMPAEWQSCVEGLRAAGDRAAAFGVTLAIEPLNRFETHFLNTLDDAARLLDEVAHPAVALHPDTFHMNIEEKQLSEAIRRAARHIRHIHLSENDRGSLGTGHVDWAGVRDALRTIGYRGWLVAETFSGRIPELAAATAIWRPVVADGWTYARESLDFLRRLDATS